MEEQFLQEVSNEEQEALEMYKTDPAKALEFLTAAAERRANDLTKQESAFFGELMVRYRDGFVVSFWGPFAPDHAGTQGGVVPKVEQRG